MTEALALEDTTALTEIAVALHLSVRGERAEVAEAISDHRLSNRTSLQVARLLFGQGPAETRALHSDLALILRALGEQRGVAVTSYERIVELFPEEALDRARRQGWSAAVMGQGRERCPYTGPHGRAWRTGHKDFLTTFDRFMEGR